MNAGLSRLTFTDPDDLRIGVAFGHPELHFTLPARNDGFIGRMLAAVNTTKNVAGDYDRS